MPLYDVIILGFRLNLPEPPERALMRVFRIDEPTARTVMRRFPVTVKRGIALELAHTFEQALLGIGARVEVRAQGEVEPARSAGPAAVVTHSVKVVSTLPVTGSGRPDSEAAGPGPSLPPPGPQRAIPPPTGPSAPPAAATPGASHRPPRVIVPADIASAVQSMRPGQPGTSRPPASTSAPPSRRVEANRHDRTGSAPLGESLFEFDDDAEIPEVDASALRYSSRPPRYSARALEHSFQQGTSSSPAARTPSARPPGPASTHSSRPPSLEPPAIVLSHSVRPAATGPSQRPEHAGASVRPPTSAAHEPLARTTAYGADLELPWVAPPTSVPPAKE